MAAKPLGAASGVEKSKKKLWSQVVEWAVEDEGLDPDVVKSIATAPRAFISSRDAQPIRETSCAHPLPIHCPSKVFTVCSNVLLSPADTVNHLDECWIRLG